MSVSDDDVRKIFLEKPRFELAAKGVFRLGRCYIADPNTHRECTPTVVVRLHESSYYTLRLKGSSECVALHRTSGGDPLRVLGS